MGRETMRSKTVVEEKKIEETVKRISADPFTVLDFIEEFRAIYPEDWETLVERFGLFGRKRRYTVSTYLSNRLDVYSHKPGSILVPFARYREARFRDYRRTTEDEKRTFGGSWIALFRKKRVNEKRTPSGSVC
jgi:hypothetical protein